MTDAAGHLLEAIDNCLQDCSVSDDAMRWSPDANAAGEVELLIAQQIDLLREGRCYGCIESTRPAGLPEESRG
jgi:hypothetical protein